MITKYKVKNINGEYSCGDIGISEQEWMEILALPKSEQYIDVLLCFLREPYHKSTCSNLGLRYGESDRYYNIQITHFNQMVQKYFNRFEVEGTDGKPTLWAICMQKGWEVPGGFSWQLREELVNALQTMLLTKLVSAYRNHLVSNGSLEVCDELYKWQLAKDCNGKSPEQIINYISKAPHFNLMDMRYSQSSLQWMLKEKHDLSVSLFTELFEEKTTLDSRLQEFSKAINKAWKNVEGKTNPGDERTIGCLLALHNPTKYGFYKRDVYEDFCTYIGEQSFPTGKKLVHFQNLLQPLISVLKNDPDLMDFVDKETSSYIHSDVYLAQDVIWQMRKIGWMAKETGKLRKCCYWLAGYSFGGTNDQFQRFMDNQIWEGSGSAKVNKEVEQIRPGDIIMLKSTYTVGPKHQQSALKIKAVGTVMTTPKKLDSSNDYAFEVKYVNTEEKEFVGFTGSYRQTVHRVSDDLFTNYANEQLGMKNPSKYQTYIDLLFANRNLILTGAPGTGKTYLARSIAEEIVGSENAEENVCFVQFHPSYDYSDFVEGLRPKKDDAGNLGFERQDGIFKEFCKKAQKNLDDSAKSQESLEKETSILERLESFLSDAVDNQTEYKTVTGTSFTIDSYDDTRVVVKNDQEKANRIIVNLTEIQELLVKEIKLNLVGDIRKHFGRKYRLQMDSYQYVICTEVRKIKTKTFTLLPDVKVVPKQNFVFIIDEINRGELSKILGELFFSIDKGYRGNTKLAVKTQYQNLVEKTDVFGKGFYIPSNVYILGTMNDIDRSVESMDYAMRRRFAWKEVLPEDRVDMWENAAWIDEAKIRMDNLNKTISNLHGLGKAYQVGPAYFLNLNDYNGDFSMLWELHISILLQEYLRGFADAEESYKMLLEAYNTTTPISDTSFQ